MLSHGKTSNIPLENKLQNNMYSTMSSAWGVGGILYYLYIDETAERWVRKDDNKLTSAVLVEKGAGQGAFILCVLPECFRRVCTHEPFAELHCPATLTAQHNSRSCHSQGPSKAERYTSCTTRRHSPDACVN